MRILSSKPLPQPRFVELVRVSGASQAAQDTPADQRAALERLRASRPGVLVARIEEGAKGLSGAAPLSKRPDLQKLLALAKERAFDEVRVRHLDRLTRHADPRERSAIFGALMDAGAVIVDAGGHVIDPNSEVGELDFTLQSIFAAKERMRIMERTRAGKERLAKQGRIMGKPPYGRSWDKVSGTWGLTDAAETYKRLYREILAGRSANEIARDLNREGVPAPRAGCEWSAATVCGLLKHEGAVGKLTSWGEPITCPPIVDVATFQRTKVALSDRYRRSGRPANPTTEALLRKVAVCECGAPIWVRGGGPNRRYYTCSQWEKTTRKGCQVFHYINDIDTDLKAALVKWLDGSYAGAAKKGSKATNPEDEVKAATKAITLLDAQEERLARLTRRGLLSMKAAEKQLGELARERADATHRLDAAKLHLTSQKEQAKSATEKKARVEMLKKKISDGTYASWSSLVAEALPRGSVRLLASGDLELDLAAP